jgi:antitoxin component YwqK of YwqJK toxin-antitoxin module
MSSSFEIFSLSEGSSKEYYPNGKLKSDYSMTNNYNQGNYFLYHNNGQIKEKGYMNNNLPHGAIYFFDEKGKPKETRHYYYGILNKVTK